jgi:transposase
VGDQAEQGKCLSGGLIAGRQEEGGRDLATILLAAALVHSLLTDKKILGRADRLAPQTPLSPAQDFFVPATLASFAYVTSQAILCCREVFMPSFTLPALPAAARLEVLEVGAAPVVRRFIELLDLPGLLQRHLPQLPGRQPDLPTATVLCVLLSNLLLARRPLYDVATWAASFVAEHIGLLPGQTAMLNDDRAGGALDHLYRADRASLFTAITLRVIRVFALVMRQLHQDTTTVTFSGEYQNQSPAETSDRPARITRGYSKDHRPDLKQLLYNRTITADGAVPVHCKVHDGNTTDDAVHAPTWLALCELIGSSDFLYVADSKLCNRDDMALIAGKGGRFLTVMPRTRAEDKEFRSRIQKEAVNWSEVYREANPRGKEKPEVVYHGFEDETGSVEGYRILWYLSSQKQQRDKEARTAKIAKTRKRLEQLRPPGRGKVFRSEQAAREAAQRVMDKAEVQDWLRVRIEKEVKSEEVQVGPGRPGAGTQYKQVQTKSYRVRADVDEEAVKRAERCDGLFPLMTNDKSLSLAQALQKYKYQPYAEKRHEQLKSVFGVRPVWLKNPKRVESLLWLYHLVEVIQALLEREVRRQMERTQTASLALYPEKRHSEAPTAELVLGAFAGLRRYQMLDGHGQTVHTFCDPLPEAAEQILNFLRIDRSAYGLPRLED